MTLSWIQLLLDAADREAAAAASEAFSTALATGALGQVDCTDAIRARQDNLSRRLS